VKGRWLLATALVATSLVCAETACADGDPASDVLLSERVFIVVPSTTAPPYLRELNTLTAEAARRRVPIRIAVIEQSSDLGAVPMLFGRAQQYATFLAREIMLIYRGTVLVVMAGKPGGVGLYGPAATPRARAALAKLAVPAAGTPEELARIASTATREVAAARGVQLTTPRTPTDTTGRGGSAWVVYASSALAAIAIGGIVFLFLRRRR
jgi:hypothetical protein